MSDAPISEADFIAFADGRLGEERRAAVAHYLEAHPDRAAEVASWERQNEAIAALFDPVANEPIPARLDPAVIASRLERARFSWPTMAAAALVLLAVGLGGGWLLHAGMSRSSPEDLLVDYAVTAHTLYVKENRHAVEVGADDRQHLLTWLSNRITTQIDAPDLSADGFELVGGRLLPEGLQTQAGPAAQLMYENAAAERLTVYVTGPLPDGRTVSQLTAIRGIDAFYWANSQITCTVVGALPDATMQTVARKVFQQLTRRPDYQGI